MIYVIRRLSGRKRLINKRMFKAPHTRQKETTYFRENRNLVKSHQKKFKDMNGPNIRRKRRPKREVIGGFKMSYRYKYYQDNIVEEDEIEEELEE